MAVSFPFLVQLVFRRFKKMKETTSEPESSSGPGAYDWLPKNTAHEFMQFIIIKRDRLNDFIELSWKVNQWLWRNRIKSDDNGKLEEVSHCIYDKDLLYFISSLLSFGAFEEIDYYCKRRRRLPRISFLILFDSIKAFTMRLNSF